MKGQVRGQGGSGVAATLTAGMYSHVLVPLDGSEAAERVLPHAQSIASAFGARLTLLRASVAVETLVAQTSGSGPGLGDVSAPIDPEPVLEAEREEAEDYLDALVGRLRAANLEVEVDRPEGQAQDVIVERARELGVDLIAMTTHGRSGLGRLVFGSVADAVLRHAPCPVLLVRVRPSDEGSASPA
jgi:nucleotide-binding universal stress UspA family protein